MNLQSKAFRENAGGGSIYFPEGKLTSEPRTESPWATRRRRIPGVMGIPQVLVELSARHGGNLGGNAEEASS